MLEERLLALFEFTELVNDGENLSEAIRASLNLIGASLFRNKSPGDFAPGCYSDSIHEHFTNSGYDLEWASFLTYEFRDDTKDDIGYAINCVRDYDDNMLLSEKELQERIIEFVSDWCENIRVEFKSLAQTVLFAET